MRDILVRLKEAADELDELVPSRGVVGGLRSKWPEEIEGVASSDLLRNAANEIERLRKLYTIRHDGLWIVEGPCGCAASTSADEALAMLGLPTASHLQA